MRTFLIDRGGLIFTRNKSEAVGSSSIRSPMIRGVFVRIYGVAIDLLLAFSLRGFLLLRNVAF